MSALKQVSVKMEVHVRTLAEASNANVSKSTGEDSVKIKVKIISYLS